MADHYSTSYKTSWALVIGIDRYQRVNPLGFAVNDADSVANTLVDTLGFPKANIVKLCNDQATRGAIRHAFLAFEGLCGKDDRVIVFFAGHGTSVDGHRGKVGYLVPVEGCLDDKSTLLRWDDFVRDAELIPAKHIFFIMDACYSGLMLQRSISNGNQRFLSDMLQRFSRQALTAGKHDEVVSDGGGPEGKNSIFTGHLVRGLRGGAADTAGVITASGLMHYVYRHVGGDSRSNQTPHCGHLDGSGDMVLKGPGGTDITTTNQVDCMVGADFAVTEPDQKITVEAREPVFLAANGYGNPKGVKFGLNEWTEKLGTVRLIDKTHTAVPAERFLSIVAEPVVRLPQPIDASTVAKALRARQWAQTPPHPRECLPDTLMTTFSSAILFTSDQHDGAITWKRFLRIEDDGTLEFADCSHLVKQLNTRNDKPGAWIWLYVQLIGLIWSVFYLLKAVYAEMGYARGIHLTVNLVGTKQTYLLDFAEGAGIEGKRWANPLSGMSSGIDRIVCNDSNISMPFQIAVSNLNEVEVKRIIIEIAIKLGRAFNHQSEPRCFNYGTRDYPWNEYNPRTY